MPIHGLDVNFTMGIINLKITVKIHVFYTVLIEMGSPILNLSCENA